MFIFILLFVLTCVCAAVARKSVRLKASPPVYSGALPLIGHAHKMLGDSEYSKSALQHVARCASGFRGVSVAYDELKGIKKLTAKGVSLKLQWVPSHIGIRGNEEADRLAKLAVLEDFCRRVFSIAQESNEKGGVLVLKIGLADYYVLTDPDDFTTAANQCLKAHFTHDFLKPWLGAGLVSGTDVPIWRRHRKLLSPAFRQHVLDGFLHIFNTVSINMVDDLAKEVGRGSFDHSTYLNWLTLEAVCQTAFGVRSGEVENFDTRTFMNAVDKLFHFVTKRIQKWWLHSDLLYSITKQKREQDEVVNYLNGISKTIIRLKRSGTAAAYDHYYGTQFKAFVDLALELADRGELTDTEVYEEVNTIIAAGYETTGKALMYTLLLLGSHANVQNKVYEELHSVFGDSKRDVEKQDLSKLVYLEAVLKESMRVYTITPSMFRCVETDIKLKNYTMPAGSNCLLFICGLHRHPSWGPDVDQFRPERWLDQASADPDAAVHKAFAAFGVGKRLCLGQTFAMMSMKTTLVHMLRQYRVSSDVTQLKLKMDPLLKPVSGHEIAIELRNI